MGGEEQHSPAEVSLEHFEQVFAATPDPVLLLTEVAGKVLAANESACRLFGYTADEMRRLSRNDLADPTDERLARAKETRARTGSFAGQVRQVRKGGARFEAFVTVSRFPGPSGEDWVWVRIADLTETLEAAERLHESQEQLRALSDAALEAVLVHEGGRILFANAAADRLYGCPPGSMAGRALDDFVAPESMDLVHRKAAAAIDTPYEAWARRADGSPFPAEVHPRTIRFQDAPRRVVTIRDLTLRKQAEADLARSDRMATIGRLAAAVAHEINNPLAFVTANLGRATELLARNATPTSAMTDELLSVLADAQEGAERVRRIVADLRTFSRDELEPSGPVDLARVVHYACGIARHELRHRAELVLRLGAVPPVRGNEARLGQVLLNLLVNAAQAIPEGAADRNRVSVSTSLASGGRVALEVNDTGSGVAPEVRSRIFEPFVTTKPSGFGTGLGLSIAQRIVQQIGGTIEVESEVGRGTTFRVLLPVADAAHAAPASTPPATGPATPPRAPRRARILAIDDEPVLRNAIAGILGPDYDVVTLPSVRAALEHLERDAAFDLVLSDLTMPERTAMDLHDELCLRQPVLAHRLAIITGGAVSERASEFLERTTRGYLAKPFTPDSLRAFVAERLASHAARV